MVCGDKMWPFVSLFRYLEKLGLTCAHDATHMENGLWTEGQTSL
jgi:hypothetical protein